MNFSAQLYIAGNVVEDFLVMLFLYPLAGYQLHQHMKDQSG